VPINSGTEWNAARRNWFSDKSRKKRSTMLSQEALVGVKCMWNLGCLDNLMDIAFITLWWLGRLTW